MKEILEKLNYKANNLEEICCGIRHSEEKYKDKGERDKLIEEIDNELEQFINALIQLKAMP